MNSKTSVTSALSITLREWRCSFRYRRNTIYRCNIDVENSGIEKTKPCPLVVRNPLYGSSQRLIFCLVLDFQGNMYMVYMGMFEEISTSFFRHSSSWFEYAVFFCQNINEIHPYTCVCLSCFFSHFSPVFHHLTIKIMFSPKSSLPNWFYILVSMCVLVFTPYPWRNDPIWPMCFFDWVSLTSNYLWCPWSLVTSKVWV